MEEKQSAGSPSAMADELAPRIAQILEAVDREADRILADVRDRAAHELEVARHQADGLVAERQRRIAELSDGLLERAETILERLAEAEAIRASFERLARALADAADRLGDQIRSGSPPTAGAEREPNLEGRRVERARHAAIRMAAAGTTKAEVAAHLRDWLQVADPDSVVDDIFGPGSGDQSRVPWAVNG
jgi:hypothetical protein